MKRFPFAFVVLLLLLTAGSHQGQAVDPFGQRLSYDKQVVHVLNRLAYGQRPGEIDNVRRMGVEKWMRLQLHPEEIPQSATLEKKLKPLESLALSTSQLFDKYP